MNDTFYEHKGADNSWNLIMLDCGSSSNETLYIRFLASSRLLLSTAFNTNIFKQEIGQMYEFNTIDISCGQKPIDHNCIKQNRTIFGQRKFGYDNLPLKSSYPKHFTVSSVPSGRRTAMAGSGMPLNVLFFTME